MVVLCTFWPEVLATAGLVELDPLKVYDLPGYTAVYITNEEGNPQKVIRLVAPATPTETAVQGKREEETQGMGKSLFRVDDQVIVTGPKGGQKNGRVKSINSDGKITVAVGNKTYRVKPDRLQLKEMA